MPWFLIFRPPLEHQFFSTEPVREKFRILTESQRLTSSAVTQVVFCVHKQISSADSFMTPEGSRQAGSSCLPGMDTTMMNIVYIR